MTWLFLNTQFPAFSRPHPQVLVNGEVVLTATGPAAGGSAALVHHSAAPSLSGGGGGALLPAAAPHSAGQVTGLTGEARL